MYKELNSENFNEEIKTGLKLVVFYTTWCKFCKNQDAVLDELIQKDFWIGKLDCDKQTQIAKKYGISGFPSFILFKEGKIVSQFSGYHTKTQLLDKLTRML